MEAFQGRLPRLPAIRKPTVVAVSSAIGLVAVVSLLVGLFGSAVAVQLLVTLVVPCALIGSFWVLTRRRIMSIERAASAQNASSRAATQYLATVAHELPLHREPTNLRAEALEVAMEYRAAADAIKVAVPDLVVDTDPFALRQILHVLITNAIQHGGARIAVWGRAGEAAVELAVSDDGPGVASDLGDGLFERFVDLGAAALTSSGAGTGLSVARELSGLMNGELAYRRDSVWSHFTLRMPLRQEFEDSVHVKIDFEAEAPVL